MKEMNNSAFETPWLLNHQMAKNWSQWIAFPCRISQHLARQNGATTVTTGLYLKDKQTLQFWAPTYKVPRTALKGKNKEEDRKARPATPTS